MRFIAPPGEAGGVGGRGALRCHVSIHPVQKSSAIANG
jgi:hypothetical protein